MHQKLTPKEEIKLLRSITSLLSGKLNLDDILTQVVHIASQVTGGDACLLYLKDKKDGELVLRASKNPHPKVLGKVKLKLGEGITGWVAEHKHPVAIGKSAGSDSRFKVFNNLPEDKYESFLSAPIMLDGEAIGVINVQHRLQHNYTPKEIELVNMIAHQVGGIIENARLYDEMRLKVRQIDTLSRISQSIVSGNYLKEILHLIVAMTAEMMGSKICSIMLLDEAGEQLNIAATQALSEEYKKKPDLKVGESVSGRAVKEHKPITVLDVTLEPDYAYKDMAKREGIVSLLSVPMMVRNKVIGVLNSYTTHEHTFTNEEINILQAIANQAAVAIENTKLMDDTLAMKEALETRKIIERAKGILMKEHNLGEQEAYKLINKKSMDTGKPMKVIAEAIITAWEIKEV